MVSRKVKEFSDLLGPYEGVRLMVESDESYKLYVYDCINEQGSCLGVINSENTVLSKLNDGDTVCCPGVAGYSCYKSALGFDLLATFHLIIYVIFSALCYTKRSLSRYLMYA